MLSAYFIYCFVLGEVSNIVHNKTIKSVKSQFSLQPYNQLILFLEMGGNHSNTHRACVIKIKYWARQLVCWQEAHKKWSFNGHMLYLIIASPNRFESNYLPAFGELKKSQTALDRYLASDAKGLIDTKKEKR